MEEFNYEEMLAQRKAQAESKAREYFYNKKERKPYYWGEGETLSDDDNHNEVFMHFTDEEVDRIKQLIIDTVNADQPDADPVSTVQEALECQTYFELFEQNEELRHLLQERCEEADLDPSFIDFDTPYYYYKFGCLAYDYQKNEVLGPFPVEVRLSDDDYLTLLTLQLLNRTGFTFNQLLRSNPELATKLSNGVEGEIYGWRYPEHVPFTVLFDEIRADAEAIGPLDEDKISL